MARPDDPVNLKFRPTKPDEVLVLHGDNDEPIARFRADKTTRKFTVQIEPSPFIALSNAMLKPEVPEAEFDHDAGDTMIPRNWKIEDGYFIAWNAENNAEVKIPIADNPGPMTPVGIPEVYGQDKMMFEVAYALMTKQHLLLSGPTGSAKTTLMLWFAQTLNWNIVSMPVNRGTEAAHLVGEYMPDPEVGSFSWVDGPVTTAVRMSQNHPTILLFDEINRIGNVAEFARILPLMDGQRILPLPEKRNGKATAEMVKAGDLYIAGTMNPVDAEDDEMGIGDYIGVQELDPALQSRFAVQPPVGYPPKDIEIAALLDRVNGAITKDIASRMVEAADRVRKSADVRFPMSFRELEAWARAYNYMGYKRAAEITVVQKANPVYRESIRALLALQG